MNKDIATLVDFSIIAFVTQCDESISQFVIEPFHLSDTSTHTVDIHHLIKHWLRTCLYEGVCGVCVGVGVDIIDRRSHWMDRRLFLSVFDYLYNK